MRITDGCPIQDTCLWYVPGFYGALEGQLAISRFFVNALDPANDSPKTTWDKLTTSPSGRWVKFD